MLMQMHENRYVKLPARRKTAFRLLFLLFALLLSGCGGKPGSPGSGNAAEKSADASSGGYSWQPLASPEDLLVTRADGTKTFQNEDGSIVLDLSHTDNGYLMIKDTNDKSIQIQITNPNGEMYPYPLKEGGEFEALPLTCGDGDYSIKVLENVSGDQYAVGLSQDFTVKLLDEFQPFLYPSQYVDYSASSDVVKLGEKLAGEAKSDLEYVQNVYNYVISNISYDEQLAESTPMNYIPEPDETLSSGKGICFDYASLMTALLRCEKVPTKLVTGYSGKAYHAWVSVYLEKRGWVDHIIFFDGKKWTLMDPTLGANNDEKEVKKYVGDGSNYTEKYVY